MLHSFIHIFNLIKCRIALKKVPLPLGSEALSIVACELESTTKAIQSTYLPLLPVVEN